MMKKTLALIAVLAITLFGQYNSPYGTKSSIARNSYGLFSLDTTLNVGIKKTIPTSALDVRGKITSDTINATGSLQINGTPIVTTLPTLFANTQTLYNSFGGVYNSLTNFISPLDTLTRLLVGTKYQMVSDSNALLTVRSNLVTQNASTIAGFWWKTSELMRIQTDAGVIIRGNLYIPSASRGIYLNSGNTAFIMGASGSPYVGINTTSALHTLHIKGVSRDIAYVTDNGSDDPQIQMYSGKATKPAYSFISNTYSGMYYIPYGQSISGGAISFNTGTSNSTYYPRLTISHSALSNTRVGVGTMAPLATFSVSPKIVNSISGVVSTNGTAVTGVGTNWTSALIGSQFVLDGNAGGTVYDGGTITAVGSTTTLTITNSLPVLSSKSYSINYAGFNVDSLGNVGIGTATPTDKLRVIGLTKSDSVSTGKLILQNNTDATIQPGKIWYDSTMRVFNGTQYLVNRSFTMNHGVLLADVNVGAANGGTALIAPVQIYSFPQGVDYPRQGKTIEIALNGIYSLRSGHAMKIALRRLDGTSLDSMTVTAAAGITSANWELTIRSTYRSVGISATTQTFFKFNSVLTTSTVDAVYSNNILSGTFNSTNVANDLVLWVGFDENNAASILTVKNGYCTTIQ